MNGQTEVNLLFLFNFNTQTRVSAHTHMIGMDLSSGQFEHKKSLAGIKERINTNGTFENTCKDS